MVASVSTAGSTASSARSGVGAWFTARYLTVDVRWLGAFRILFGGLLTVEGLRRWAAVRQYYSNDGFFPNHYSLFAPMGRDVFSIFHAFGTVGEASIGFALAVTCFALFMVGYRTRLFHLLSALFITSLNARNIFVENGGTVVVNILAIWTLFLPLGTRFSVDALLSSLREHPEKSAAQLNDRAARAPSAAPFVSLVSLALILQWSVIYFFNAVHKTGIGWRNGTALHWFWHQDRIVTWLGVWAREHEVMAITHAMTWGTLVIEGTLSGLLLVPFFQTWTRRLALLLAFSLHGGIASFSRLGPFSYVMTIFFVLWLGERDWQLATRWFGKPGRARTLIYDADCGVCLLAARILARLDVFERITFVGNDQVELLPPGVDPALFDSTIVVVDPAGVAHVEERAVFQLGRALPFGTFAVWWLRVPVLAWIGRALYRAFARRRLRVSMWIGLGACGLPPAPTAAADNDADPAGAVASTDEPPSADVRPLREELAVFSGLLREGIVALLMVVAATQVANDNPWLRRRVAPLPVLSLMLKQAPWMVHVVGYPRIFQGWGMFAPEPPYDDGHVVVDGRTVDGRKLDPFTGKEPDFDPYSATGWGHDQFWCDYNNRIRFSGHQGNRQHLSDYLVNQHEYSHRPQDRLVAFDVWWVQDRSPPPGQLKGAPLPPEKLVSHGYVRDSGATPWLHPGGRP